MIRANELPQEAWRKSTYSSDNGGNCIEVADGLPVVPVRDSKTENGPVITFSPASWSAFVSSVR